MSSFSHASTKLALALLLLPLAGCHRAAETTSDQAAMAPQEKALYEAARQPKRMIVVPGDWHVLSVVDGRSYTNDVVAFMLRK